MSEKKTPENKKITIYDIAKEAGVSASTVSRVLTNTVGVRPSNREKVMQIIEKYNFRPNALARSLSDTKRKALGIVMPDIKNPFYAHLFTCCAQVAHTYGYSMLLEITMNNQELEAEYLSFFDEQQTDAIILVGGQVDNLNTDPNFAEHVNRICSTTPVVIAGKLDATFCPQVMLDTSSGIDLIMEHLLSLGHRDIAIIGGMKSVTSAVQMRMRYKQILLRNQIACREEFTEAWGYYDIDTGYQLMHRFLKDGPIPTAVITVNDFVGIGAENCILDHGLRIPEDISVVSHDNTLLCECARPQMTSIDYGYQTFADRLVRTAIAASEGQMDLPQLQLVKSFLVLHNSTGPASRGR